MTTQFPIGNFTSDRTWRVRLLVAALASCTSLTTRAGEPRAADARVSFSRDVAPLLSEHCLSCHGGERQESGLRLDQRQRAFQGGDSGAVLVPGKSADSELIRRVTAEDPDERMPPAEANEPLSDEQIALLKRWIDEGADWPATADTALSQSSHWSYQPVASPDPPRMDSAWIRSPIDAFILSRLQQEQLTPSPEADSATLLRRLYLDLWGLVPTLGEQREFLSDTRSDAYEQLVNRLLESPHFGERWGRHWLDLARYADSNGYELDVPRPNAWRYRDWVVQAYNDDLPYDRFILEQMAGDLLPEANLAQRIATGFHRMSLKNDETGLNEEDFRRREIVDRVNTCSTAVLGLTMGCAECHSHKYDPITQTEYYRFYAFFEHSGEDDQEIEGTPSEISAYHEHAAHCFDRWTAMQIQNCIVEALLEQGAPASRSAIEATYENSKRQLASQRLLRELGRERWLAQVPQDIRDALGAPSAAANLLMPDSKMEKGYYLNSFRTYFAALDSIIGSLEARLSSLERYTSELGAPVAVIQALLASDESRTAEQRRDLDAYFGALPAQRDYLQQELMQLRHELYYVPRPYVMTLKESPNDGRETHVLLRGDFKQKGPVVQPGTPAFLPALNSDIPARNRLDLARWMVAPENPLTRRVAVNHVWAHLFGRGLVSTVDDFGVRGEPPSHPELLDWLAGEFLRQKWSCKELIRQIVLSSTYRQASDLRPDLQERDPLNVLLARQSRFRVEGETVRDLFLSASGLLDRTVGGPTIYPEIPASVRELGYKYRLYWPTSPAPDQYRRGIYVHLRRSNPYPSLVMFDAPEGTNCTAFRNRSNTPLQALTTLNDPVFVVNAQTLGHRAVLEGPADIDARLDWLFERCLVRQPLCAEREILRELLQQELSTLLARPQVSAEPSASDAVPDRMTGEVAAWTTVARTVLNLDEFVTRR